MLHEAATLCCRPKHQNMLMGVPQRGTNTMEMFSQLPSIPRELLLGDARLNAGSVLTSWGRQGCLVVWLTWMQTCHPCCLPQPSPRGRRSGMEAILGGKLVWGAGSTRKQGQCGRRRQRNGSFGAHGKIQEARKEVCGPQGSL